jgi:transcription elongation factor GreA
VWRTAAQYSTFTHVRAFSIFADHDKIVWRDMAWCNTSKWSLVDIQVKVEAHLQQQTALDNARGYIWCSDCTQQNGIECAQFIQHAIREDLAVTQIAHATQVELGCVDGHPSGSHYLYSLGRDFWSDSVPTNECNAMCHRQTIVEGTGSLPCMAKHLLSKETYARLEAEIAHLEHNVLPEVADKIGRAREMGDLKENGDYHAAKDEYGMFNDRKNLLLSILESAEIALPPANGEVGVMSVVTILFAGDDPDDAETYLIGHIEEKRTDGVSADVMSPVSPIGGALLGHKAGDDVSVTLENGAKVSVTIVKVDN